MTELETLLGKQWTNRDGSPDQSMVKYCMKSKYIDLGPYYLDVGDKPTIDSDIWYDDETARPTIDFETFRNYNMRHNGPRDLDQMIASGRVSILIFNQYTHDSTDGKIKGWTTSYRGEEPRLSSGYRPATDDDIKAIRQGLAELRRDYEKRLVTYWKRYSSKVMARGYWANR